MRMLMIAAFFASAAYASCPLCASGIPHACASCGSAFAMRIHAAPFGAKNKAGKQNKTKRKAARSANTRANKRGVFSIKNEARVPSELFLETRLQK